MLCAAILPLAVQAGPKPYNESADAKADIEAALLTAHQTQRKALVIFGANWCADCRTLDTALKTPATAAQVAKDFVVVKVDVGNFDRNPVIVKQYGNPTAGGIPAAVILTPANKLLFSTQGGELANARRMGETGIADFLRQAAVKTAAR